jgi:hypothetical protein
MIHPHWSDSPGSQTKVTTTSSSHNCRCSILLLPKQHTNLLVVKSSSIEMTLSPLRISSATSLIRWTIPFYPKTRHDLLGSQSPDRQHFISLRLFISSSSSSAAASHYNTHHQSSTKETTIFAIELLPLTHTLWTHTPSIQHLRSINHLGHRLKKSMIASRHVLCLLLLSSNVTSIVMPSSASSRQLRTLSSTMDTWDCRSTGAVCKRLAVVRVWKGFSFDLDAVVFDGFLFVSRSCKPTSLCSLFVLSLSLFHITPYQILTKAEA